MEGADFKFFPILGISLILICAHVRFDAIVCIFFLLAKILFIIPQTKARDFGIPISTLHCIRSYYENEYCTLQ